MKLTLGSNIASLIGQRNLKETSKKLSKVYERLSSGMRINKASDDAAGLTIAESLRADSRVFTQAIRNVNDGMSALSIAEGAISELTNIVTRIRELATQSANGALSNTQRASIDEEAQALSKEFTRIQQFTEFNDMGLLNGATDEISIQAGFGTDGSITSGVGEFLGNGTFEAPISFTVGDFNYSVDTGDFNGDGIVDIVTADRNDNEVNVLLGTGNGQFNTPSAFSVGNNPWDISTGDVNGDGVLDLVTIDRDDDKASVLLGTGNGSFSSATSFGVGNDPQSLSLGDFNGDGIPDLVSANSADGTISVMLNNGSGQFSSATSFSAGLTPIDVKAGDFNGDGILDLVTAGFGNDTVSVLLGTGEGLFSSAISYSVGDAPRSVSTGDFNGDGVLDLVTADRDDDTISVLLGTGDGQFSSANSFSVGGDPISVSAGDFNGDGILDLVTADYVGDTASVLLGLGNGQFSSAEAFSVGEGPRSVKTGDLNGDGVLDLVTVNKGEALNVILGSTTDGVAPILEFSLKTKADALQAMGPLDRKLETLTAQRGFIGAFQSRLEVANNVLQGTVENYINAESRIRDADIAEEVSKMVRMQILQNAGTAVLAQANQQPALAIQLLS